MYGKWIFEKKIIIVEFYSRYVYIFIYLYFKLLSSIYYVLGMVFGDENIVVIKIDKLRFTENVFKCCRWIIIKMYSKSI